MVVLTGAEDFVRNVGAGRGRLSGAARRAFEMLGGRVAGRAAKNLEGLVEVILGVPGEAPKRPKKGPEAKLREQLEKWPTAGAHRPRPKKGHQRFRTLRVGSALCFGPDVLGHWPAGQASAHLRATFWGRPRAERRCSAICRGFVVDASGDIYCSAKLA